MTARQRFDQASDRVDRLEQEIESKLGRFNKFAVAGEELSEGRWKQAEFDAAFYNRFPDIGPLVALIIDWREAKAQSKELYELIPESDRSRIIAP